MYGFVKDTKVIKHTRSQNISILVTRKQNSNLFLLNQSNIIIYFNPKSYYWRVCYECVKVVEDDVDPDKKHILREIHVVLEL